MVAMEGRYAMRTVNLRSKIPFLCAASFAVGCALESIMCVSGFYNIYDVKQGMQIAEQKREDEEFWMRVEARRQAKAKASIINDS